MERRKEGSFTRKLIISLLLARRYVVLFLTVTYIYIYIFVSNCTISKNLASEWSENAWRRKKIREIREKGLKTLFHRFISLGGLCCRVFSRNFSPSFPLLRRKVLVRFLRGREEEEKKVFHHHGFAENFAKENTRFDPSR